MNAPIVPAKRESSDDRRVAIALAARALIVEKGMEGLRTRDIAERVGINIATLHYHVPSKEALVTLVAESISADFRAQSERRPGGPKSALEQLHLEFDEFRETLSHMPDLIIVLTELAERGRRDPAVASIVRPIYHHWRTQFAQLIQQGCAEGTFRPEIDPTAAAVMLTGALSDYARDWPEPRVDLATLFTELERAFAAHTLTKRIL